MDQEIKKTTISNTDFLCFCKQLDNVHNTIVAEQRCPNATVLENLDQLPNVYMMYVDKKPAGCIAFSNVKNDLVEVGRVFVKEEYRRAGNCN